MTHYQTLGVQENATDADIKKAYKKLAMQHHPDKGGDAKMFQKISEAYDSIKTQEKRQQYNQFRKFGPNVKFRSQPFDFDIFKQFNDMFDGDPFVQRRPTRNKNMSITVPVTLEEAFQGIKRQISVQLGSGQRQVVDLDIPAGVNNGMTLNYKGLGDNSVKGVPAGDLQVRLQVNRHAFFERKNHDLYTSKQINAFEAMLGTKVIIKTINLKTIKATVVPGTQPGTFIRIPNEGMPIMRTNNRGHLFVRIDINIPSNLTQEEKEIITKNFIK
jgi:curved DNA-binding protein